MTKLEHNHGPRISASEAAGANDVARRPGPLRPAARVGNAVRRHVRRNILAILVFTIMTVGAVYPIIPDMPSRIGGWQGDNVQYVYITGWMAQALLLGHSPFVDPRLNYPDTLILTATDIPYLSILALAPCTWVFGPIFSYNLIILLSFWLSGYCTYLWLDRITEDRFGGIVAGLIFLLTPYRVAHSYGHLQMVSTYALPLFFWSLDTTLQQAIPQRRAFIWLGLATFLVGSSSQYYLVISLIIGGCYTLAVLVPRVASIVQQGWKLLVSVALGAFVSALPYVYTWLNNLYSSHDSNDTRIWSADPINFILPSKLHPLWGELVEHARPEPLWIEKTLYISVAACVLAGIALLWRSNPYRRRVHVWAAVAAVAFVLALGTDLHLDNRPYSQTNPVWLPAYYLAHLPIGKLLRVWARFGVITVLFVAMLAGVGAALIQALFPRRRRLIELAIVALLIVDLLPGTVATAHLAPRPVDHWLAQQPGDFAIAVLPANQDEVNYMAMFGSLFHAKHLPAYNHPVHRSQAYLDFMQRAAAFPSSGSLEALRQMGLRYIVLERRFFNGDGAPTWASVAQALAQSPRVAIAADLDDVVVVGFK